MILQYYSRQCAEIRTPTRLGLWCIRTLLCFRLSQLNLFPPSVCVPFEFNGNFLLKSVLAQHLSRFKCRKSWRGKWEWWIFTQFSSQFRHIWGFAAKLKQNVWKFYGKANIFVWWQEIKFLSEKENKRNNLLL